MDAAEGEIRLNRYLALFEKQDRTPSETFEMNRLLYQVGLLIASNDGRTKAQYLAGNSATKQFHDHARKLQISESGFVFGGVAAGVFAEGLTEAEFLEQWRNFDADSQLQGYASIATAELKAAGLWPWDKL